MHFTITKTKTTKKVTITTELLLYCKSTYDF